MTQEMAILSPEKTIVTYRLAGVGSRLLAHVFDLIIVIMVSIGIAVIISLTFTRIDEGLGSAVSSIFFAFGWLLYFVLLEGLWNGQTPGKKAMKIRVRMADATAITFPAALARNILRFGDILPAGYLFGLLAMFTNPKSQRLGDMAAGTIVIYDREGTPRFAPTPYALGTHAFEQSVGDLRGMTMDEYVALKQLCDRFPELPQNVQDRLLAEVWRPIAQRRNIKPVQGVHPIYLAEATVMKFGRAKGLM